MQSITVGEDEDVLMTTSPDDLIPSIKKLNEATINKIGNIKILTSLL